MIWPGAKINGAQIPSPAWKSQWLLVAVEVERFEYPIFLGLRAGYSEAFHEPKLERRPPSALSGWSRANDGEP